MENTAGVTANVHSKFRLISRFTDDIKMNKLTGRIPNIGVY